MIRSSIIKGGFILFLSGEVLDYGKVFSESEILADRVTITGTQQLSIYMLISDCSIAIKDLNLIFNRYMNFIKN